MLVASDATRMSCALFQQDRLHALFKESVVQRGRTFGRKKGPNCENSQYRHTSFRN